MQAEKIFMWCERSTKNWNERFGKFLTSNGMNYS